jgi:hypothetical protein
MEPIPCINCICLAICKARVIDSYEKTDISPRIPINIIAKSIIYLTLIHKCSIFKQMFESEDGDGALNLLNMDMLLPIFNIPRQR